MKIKSKSNGSALLITIGMMMVISIALATLHNMASQQVHSTIIIRDKLKARMIAESGLNMAYNKLRHDFEGLNNFQMNGELNNGEYTVTAEVFSDSLENRAQLTSVGTCGIGRSVVTADLENRPAALSGSSGEDNFFSLPYSITINGTLFGRGNGDYTVNSIHSNTDIRFIGSTDFYEPPDLSSSGTVDLGKKQSGAVGTVTENAPQISIPQVPVEAFIAIADANNQIYDSPSDFPANPPGGVAVCTASSGMWNDENPNTGCYIFLGDFHVSSGLNVSADSSTGYPAIICLGTSVHIAGSGNKSWHQINGALYAPNAAIHITGGTIRGPIVCGQDFDYSGTGNIFESGDSDGFNLPPNQSAMEDAVVITAWH